MSQVEDFLQLVLTDAGRFTVGLVSWSIFYLYRNRNTWLYSILDWRSRMGCKVRIPRAAILRWKLLPRTRADSGEPYYLYEARVKLQVKNVDSRTFNFQPPGLPPRRLDPKEGQLAEAAVTLTFSSGEIDGHYEDAPFYPQASAAQLGLAWFSLRLASTSSTAILRRRCMREGSIDVVELATP